MNEEQEKELIDNLIRDITSVDYFPITKSEVRRRIEKILKAQRENMIKVIEEKIKEAIKERNRTDDKELKRVYTNVKLVLEEIIKVLQDNE